MYWSLGAFVTFEGANYTFQAFTHATVQGVDLLLALLPETTLLLMIVYLIHAVGIELGRGRSKKALAVEVLGASQEAAGFIV